MKKTSTLQLLALFSLLLGSSLQASAQDEFETVGYANVWHSLKAVPEGGGKVCATTTANGLKTWKATVDFNQTLSVAQMIDSHIIMYFIFARAEQGYTFAGWYEDADGDGVFDQTKDEFLSDEAEYIMMDILDDDYTIYATQAEARNGQKPTVPQHTVFAYFTRGATVGVSYYQDPEHANCGSVFVDKPLNEPGDVVTARALPTDGFQFEYWQSESRMGSVVSRDNPYTFTVSGGERLYAYFTAIDAPEFDLPEEGGFRVVYLNAPWVMTEETALGGAHILVLEAEDFTRTADGKVYLDMSKEEVMIDLAQQDGLPTIIYGKGHVRFAYKMGYGIARKSSREALVRWSGNRGATVKGENLYVYAFNESLGAFLSVGNTDQMINPEAPTEVQVAAGQAYFSMSAFDLVDDQGNIPAVIGLSPETFDQAMTVIGELSSSTVSYGKTSAFQPQTVYDLQGRKVSRQLSRGLYIVDGRKLYVK